MSSIAAVPPRTTASSYSESRRHEVRKSRLVMVDGNLVSNAHSVEAGASARVYEGGYWGFASTSETAGERVRELADLARRNAGAMARFGLRKKLELPRGRYRGEHEFKGIPDRWPIYAASRG